MMHPEVVAFFVREHQHELHGLSSSGARSGTTCLPATLTGVPAVSGRHRRLDGRVRRVLRTTARLLRPPFLRPSASPTPAVPPST